MDNLCRVPGCGDSAVVGDWREPFGRFRWGVNLAITVEDIAVTWPLCAKHGDLLLAAALDAVGRTLTDWGLAIDYRGIHRA